MPIPVPILDDRTFDDLVEEALSRIPALAPEWTDHNESDPGITLIELFAWLTEQLLYRVDRIPAANEEVFLRLLNGPDWSSTGDREEDVRRTIRALREQYRAVTPDDFEYLAIRQWPRTDSAAALIGTHGEPARILRARCVAEVDLELQPDGLEPAPGHVSLIVVPAGAAAEAPPPQELLDGLEAWLDERRLLTTRLHVVGPRYAAVRLARATLNIHEDARADQVGAEAVDALRDRFHPLRGGDDGKGWPFGRDVYLSEIYELLDSIPGVDYVEGVELDAEEGRLQGSGIRVAAHELVALTIDSSKLTILSERGD